MRSQLVLENLTFAYDASPAPLLQSTNLSVGPGWTGVVGPNGCGKTTFLNLAVGILRPTAGRLLPPLPAVYCPQRTDDPPADLETLQASPDASTARLCSRLGLGEDWARRWPSLSHGERKRAQIAVALAGMPALLAVDEPTNHLDRPSRDLLLQGLEEYRGVGLLVSHDRELLDRLGVRCLFLEPPNAALRPGGHTAAAGIAKQERDSARRAYVEGARRARALHREVARRREEADRAGRKRSKRGIDRHDTDAKAKIDLAVFTGKDGQAGRLLRQVQSREARLQGEVREAWVPPERKLRFWMPGSVYKGDRLVRLPASRLALGPVRTLVHPELVVRPGDRIALTGPNGAGKSTLVRALVQSLAIPPERVVYLPQEVGSEESRVMIGRVRDLEPPRLGHLMTVIAALGSDPRRILGTDLPSPGEARKLLLGLGVVQDPWFVIMDEPTNHLDLPSIELLEQSLSACPCALLVVSHDTRFLEALGCAPWRIEADGGDWRLRT